MDVKNKREVTLYNIFLKYLIVFCVVTAIEFALSVVIFNISGNTGILLTANYAENHLEGLKNSILKDEKFDKSKVKYPYSYGFYDKNFQLVNSDFNDVQLDEASRYIRGDKNNTKYIYKAVKRKDGTCVISYDIRVHFSSEYLNNICPYPELLMFVLFLISFVISSIIIVRKFGKRLRMELKPLKKSTELIMQQNLDFETESTNIKEFNEVLSSIENMKAALKQSLEIEWKSERKKKEQISALAHDIKTPLTIIKGNSELLLESDIQGEDKEYIDYITKNTDKIEKYISILLDISKSENDINYKMETIEFNDFFEELVSETNMLCKSKNVKSIVNNINCPDSFKGNRSLLMRALMNIISNAVDYSKEEDEIEVNINRNNDKLIFTVKDCGTGFTKEGLKNATDQFYMGESERNVAMHYGIGLYIAENVAKKHGGKVILNNRKDRAGAEVSLIISL